MILHSTNATLRTRATLAAATFNLIDALGLCILSHIEHIRSVRPSAIINIYLMITLPFDIARCRTLWTGGDTKHIAAVFTSTLGVKLMLVIAEAIEKRDILLERYRTPNREVTSGIYSRSFFWWLNNLMTTGKSGSRSNNIKSNTRQVFVEFSTTKISILLMMNWPPSHSKLLATVHGCRRTERNPVLCCGRP